MKKILLISCLISLIWVSCNEMQELLPKSSFDGFFPKRNLNLANIFGDELMLKSGLDTLHFKVLSNSKINLITNINTGDTLFNGRVSRFRGFYYFSQQFNDTSYWIYAVKLRGNLIYGLNTALAQTVLIDKAIENGKHSKLVKYIHPERIRLHPDKREMKKLFSSILDSIPPDTILNLRETNGILNDTSFIAIKIDPDDFEFIAQVYPNPTTDFINIQINKDCNLLFDINDLQGKKVLSGQLKSKSNIIDFTRQPAGIYVLSVHSLDGKEKEAIKIIKAIN